MIRGTGTGREARLGQQRGEAIGTALAAARKRNGRGGFFGRVYLYCENPACPSREVEVTRKECNGTTSPNLRCPECSCPLLLLHVWTLAETIAEDMRRGRAATTAALGKVDAR